jgi:hypothetical protein
MIDAHKTTAPVAISVSESHYLENGSTIAKNATLVERLSGTRRLIFLECDCDAVGAQLPESWTIRDEAFPRTNLIPSFNDWVLNESRWHTSPQTGAIGLLDMAMNRLTPGPGADCAIVRRSTRATISAASAR